MLKFETIEGLKIEIPSGMKYVIATTDHSHFITVLASKDATRTFHMGFEITKEEFDRLKSFTIILDMERCHKACPVRFTEIIRFYINNNRHYIEFQQQKRQTVLISKVNYDISKGEYDDYKTKTV